MTWFISWIVTGVSGLLAALALAASEALGAPGPIPAWGSPIVLLGEIAVFVGVRWVTRQKLNVALARPESTGISPPTWLVVSTEWFAESRPIWMLPFAAVAAVTSLLGSPLLVTSSAMTAIWGVIALLPITLTASALFPDGAHRLSSVSSPQ